MEAGLVQVLAQERLRHRLEPSDLSDDEVVLGCSVLVVVAMAMGVLGAAHGLRVSSEHVCPSFLHAERDHAASLSGAVFAG